MARASAKNRLKAWQQRVEESNKAYKKWNEEYFVDRLESVYLGPGQMYEDENNYVINKIFPTVEIGIPSLLYYNPIVKIKPRPARADDTVTNVDARAKLQEDTVNTFITDPELNFKSITTLSLKESFFVFGVVEVGYSMDLIDNPLADKPELTDEQTMFAGMDKVPNFNSTKPESLYLKRIPAKQFRVPVNSCNILEHNDWSGYYQWEKIQDVKANPRYKNTSGLKLSGKQSQSVSEPDEEKDKDEEGIGRRDMIKVWRIWDMRTNKRYIWGDCNDKFFVDGEPYDTYPFAAYKPYEQLDTFYPLPPVYNWLYPQDEMNDIRNKKRIHRQRSNRKWTYRNGSIDEDQLEKLESDSDNVYAVSNEDDPLKPVPLNPLDPSMYRDEQVTEFDFREITGVSSEDRGEAKGDTTATQANIVEGNKRIRESYKRQLVGEWLARIATIMLKLIIKKMALPFWIKMNVDPVSPGAPAEAMTVTQEWMLIVSEELGDMQLDISVDIDSLSPLSEEGERQNWMQVMSLLTNPQVLAVMLSSDLILKKTLAMFGIHSRSELNEFRKAGEAMMTMTAAAAAAEAGVQPGGGQGAGPGPTPSNAGIQGQLAAQGVG